MNLGESKMHQSELNKILNLNVPFIWMHDLKEKAEEFTNICGIETSIQELIRLAIKEKYNLEGGMKKRTKWVI